MDWPVFIGLLMILFSGVALGFFVGVDYATQRQNKLHEMARHAREQNHKENVNAS